MLQNGASRSLRAALWRFAELAHLIRPQKCRYRHSTTPSPNHSIYHGPCRLESRQESFSHWSVCCSLAGLPAPFSSFPCRPYLVNLLPCLTRITKRQEETVQETLAAAMPKTMAALGHFANDGEIKVWCQKRNDTTHRTVGLGRVKRS